MSDQIYISRNFVEFGAFKLAEVLDFKKRGIIQDHDYLRTASSEEWTPANSWLSDFSVPATKPKPAAKKAAAKKSPATKKPA